MIVYRDECVGCSDLGLPCMGSSCRYRNVPYAICDECGDEIDDDVDFDEDKHLCEECKEKLLVED